MKADIHFYQDVEWPAPRHRERRPRIRDGGVVHDERQNDPLRQREHAIRVDGMERVGEPDVGDPFVGEDLGLAELRAADADGAALDLQGRDPRRLVRLGVRAQPQPARVRRGLHARQVARELRRVHQDRGSGQVRNPQRHRPNRSKTT